MACRALDGGAGLRHLVSGALLRGYVPLVRLFCLVTLGLLAPLTAVGIDVRNRNTPWRTDPIAPGRMYAFTWPLVPYDHVFQQGHRIGLVIIGTDRDYTLRYPPGTKVTVAGGALSLPLAGPMIDGLREPRGE